MRNLQGYSPRGMGVRFLRGQALLLVVVGTLGGTVLAGIVMTREGLPAPLAAKIGDLIAPPRSGLPARIEVGGSDQLQSTARSQPARSIRQGTQPGAGPLGRAQASQPPARPASPAPRTGKVTVVPAPVYTYPPNDHGGDHRSGRGGGDGYR